MGADILLRVVNGIDGEIFTKNLQFEYNDNALSFPQIEQKFNCIIQQLCPKGIDQKTLVFTLFSVDQQKQKKVWQSCNLKQIYEFLCKKKANENSEFILDVQIKKGSFFSRFLRRNKFVSQIGIAGPVGEGDSDSDDDKIDAIIANAVKKKYVKDKIVMEYKEQLIDEYKGKLFDDYKDKLFMIYKLRLMKDYKDMLYDNYKDAIFYHFKQQLYYENKRAIYEEFKDELMSEHEERLYHACKEMLYEEYKEELVTKMVKAAMD